MGMCINKHSSYIDNSICRNTNLHSTNVVYKTYNNSIPEKNKVENLFTMEIQVKYKRGIENSNRINILQIMSTWILFR